MDQRGQQNSETVEFEHYEPGAPRVDRRRAPPPPTNIALVQKAYQCPECERSFDRPSSLQQHILVHTGEQPHVCRWCGMRRFSTTSNVYRHERSCKNNPNRVSSSVKPPPSISQESSSALADDYDSEELYDDSHSPTQSRRQGSDMASYDASLPSGNGLPGSGRSAYEAIELPSSYPMSARPPVSPSNVRGVGSTGGVLMPGCEDYVQPHHNSSLTTPSIPLALHHLRLDSSLHSGARPEDARLQQSMMVTNDLSDMPLQRNLPAHGGATSIPSTDVVYPSNVHSSSSPPPRFIYPSTSSVAREALSNDGAYPPALVGTSNASRQILSTDPGYPDPRSNFGRTGAAGQSVRHAYTSQTGLTTNESHAQGASSPSDSVRRAAATDHSLEQDDPNAVYSYQYTQ